MDNETLYLRRLNEKLNVKELRKELYALFGVYGRIIDIVARSTVRMKGQAFIIFESASSAKSAMQALQGAPFFGNPLEISFSRSRSDFHTKRDGSYLGKGMPRPEVKSVDAVPAPMAVHKILFVENAPEDLEEIFCEQMGFLESRSVPSKPGIAFVEFANEEHAADAKEKFQGHLGMKITFAKK